MMTKRQFKVEVIRVDKYTIEVDLDVMNEAWMEDFRERMYNFDSIEDHIQHIAQYRARFNNNNVYGGFQEGYGDLACGGKTIPNSKHPFEAVNFVKLDENNNIEIEVY